MPRAAVTRSATWTSRNSSPAGIDVFTTLNIQHVESLNDVVAQITRIRVRETVPDAIIERADDIEVIDITPQDLIQRLNEGKVYVPQTAQRAVAHYFSPGNLTALRELALRRTAQRVDAQLLTHMQANAIPGPWAAGERVLVCIDDTPGSEALVRYARRMTERLQAPWTVLHVETAASLRRSEAASDRINETLRLAERLGGEAVTIPGRDVASEAVRYAETHNATHIIIGKPAKSRLAGDDPRLGCPRHHPAGRRHQRPRHCAPRREGTVQAAAYSAGTYGA